MLVYCDKFHIVSFDEDTPSSPNLTNLHFVLAEIAACEMANPPCAVKIGYTWRKRLLLTHYPIHPRLSLSSIVP